MRVTIGTGVLLLALAACGQVADQSTGAQPGSTTGPAVSTPPSPTSTSLPPLTAAPPPGSATPPGATLLPKDQVDTGALPSHYTERRVWAFDGGRSLQLFAMARTGCSGVTARVADQGPDAVHIVISPMNIPQGGPADGGGMCTQVITPRPVTVTLDAPLGNRKVFVAEVR